MDNNPQQEQPGMAQTPQPVVQQPIVTSPVQQQPQVNPVQSPTPKSGVSMKVGLLIFLVLVIGSLSVAGYLILNVSKKTNNAQVYNQQAVKPQATVTPTPTPGINPNDTSDQAINNDSQTVNQNLGTVGQDMQAIDQSFNDQQTNLQ